MIDGYVLGVWVGLGVVVKVMVIKDLNFGKSIDDGIDEFVDGFL